VSDERIKWHQEFAQYYTFAHHHAEQKDPDMSYKVTVVPADLSLLQRYNLVEIAHTTNNEAIRQWALDTLERAALVPPALRRDPAPVEEPYNDKANMPVFTPIGGRRPFPAPEAPMAPDVDQ
jgi:hypothetical protein